MLRSEWKKNSSKTQFLEIIDLLKGIFIPKFKHLYTANSKKDPTNDAGVEPAPKKAKSSKKIFLNLHNVSDEEEAVVKKPLTKVEILKKTRFQTQKSSIFYRGGINMKWNVQSCLSWHEAR